MHEVPDRVRQVFEKLVTKVVLIFIFFRPVETGRGNYSEELILVLTKGIVFKLDLLPTIHDRVISCLVLMGCICILHMLLIPSVNLIPVVEIES